jgi:NADH-quinone oxidoreductase subunit F
VTQHILLRDLDIPDIGQFDVYVQHGGYGALRQALTMKPEEVMEVVKASGLRGRGGAGFPTGLKWSFIPKDVFPRYVTVNADESEPGTFKDRQIMGKNPHQLVEGAAIAAYAVRAEKAYIYCRGEFAQPARTLQAAVDAVYQAGYLGQNIFGSGANVDIVVHLGAGAYICGEETALLDSLEGKIGQPRLRPPFPATAGLYGKPTIVNNVETLANVPFIVANGAETFRKFGTEKSPGTKIACLSGHVKRPGNYEFELGKITFRNLIFGEEYGQGLLHDGATVKAIMPSGASSVLLGADKLDTPLDYESVAATGSMLGSASVIVLDSTADIVWAMYKAIRFFKHESCGKCTPCREGTFWMLRIYERLINGRGTLADIDLLDNVAGQMQNKCFCLLGEFSIAPVQSSIKLFRDEYLAKVTQYLS